MPTYQLRGARDSLRAVLSLRHTCWHPQNLFESEGGIASHDEMLRATPKPSAAFPALPPETENAGKTAKNTLHAFLWEESGREVFMEEQSGPG